MRRSNQPYRHDLYVNPAAYDQNTNPASVPMAAPPPMNQPPPAPAVDMKKQIDLERRIAKIEAEVRLTQKRPKGALKTNKPPPCLRLAVAPIAERAS